MKKYKTIVVDPPWKTHAGATSAIRNGKRIPISKKSAKLNYPTMTLQEIYNLPIDKISAIDSNLYLWTINKYIPDAYKIAEKWGFKPSAMLVWCKNPLGVGLGDNYSINTEFCLYARKGHPKIKKTPRNWWGWKRGKHSQKPEEFQDIIEQTSPPPYLELFARRKRDGWDVWGNEVESDISFN